ncbi:DUF2946 domain-containing protein [Pandoraea apista]|uniref:DUF2946 domain-containing protein n=1 Tax=Pandoraea apista TaxID=93218 RepID=UPI00248DDC60|nr:DUF2946 domain-containing protein [Pandoraea apista]
MNMPVWSRSKRIAWAGLAAMWMLLCAPLISQYLRAHPSSLDDALSGTFCTSLDETAVRGQHTPVSHGAGASAACGYCSLLAHTPPLPPATLTLADIRLGNERLAAGDALSLLSTMSAGGGVSRCRTDIVRRQRQRSGGWLRERHARRTTGKQKPLFRERPTMTRLGVACLLPRDGDSSRA